MSLIQKLLITLINFLFCQYFYDLKKLIDIYEKGESTFADSPFFKLNF